MYINKVMLYGNLTRDPEVSRLESGITIARIGLATNRMYKSKEGEKKEEVEYHTVTFFGKQAELLETYMKKGSPLYVEGRLRTSSWDDKTTGAKKYRTEVIAENMQFGPKRSGGMGSDNEIDDFPSSSNNSSGEPTISPDDIPF